MEHNLFDDVQVKLERVDSQLENFQMFIHSGSPVNLNENIRDTLTNVSREPTPIQSHNVLSSTRCDKRPIRNWLDELIEFSTNIARDTHSVLGRIKNDFQRSGLQFDPDFRDHFLYISSNRLKESYDSFLIGLSKEMKSDDSKVNKPRGSWVNPTKTIVRKVPNSLPAAAPPAKRKCPDDEIQRKKGMEQLKALGGPVARQSERENSIQTKVINSRSAQLSKSTPSTQLIQSTQTTQSTQSTRSIQSTRLSRNVDKIGSEISIKKIVSKVTETSTSDDVIIVDAEEVSKTINPKNRKKSLDAARCHTDFVMYLAENRISSPKTMERRMTIGAPMVTIPSKQMNPKLNAPKNVDEKMSTRNSLPKSNEMVKENVKSDLEKIQISSRRKSCVEKSTQPTKLPSNSNPQGKYHVLSVTLPEIPVVTGIVTRSRGNSGFAKVTHKCELCDYKTDVKTNLLRHQLVHSGEKPFKCKTCKKGFTQKVNLLSHMRGNHHNLHGNPTYWELN